MSRMSTSRLYVWSQGVTSLLAMLPLGSCVAFGYGDVGPADSGAADASSVMDSGDAWIADGGKMDRGLQEATVEDARIEDGAIDAAADTGSDARVGDAALDAAVDAPADAGTDASIKDAGDSATDAAEAGSDAAVCVGAQCKVTCSAGWGDCDGLVQNGCETDLNSPDHCGACGQVCSPNGGTPFCAAGECDTLCDLSGTFALKMTLQTSWPATSAIAGGSGDFEYWLGVLATQQDDEVAVQLLECGRTVPPFSLQIGKTSCSTIPTACSTRRHCPRPQPRSRSGTARRIHRSACPW